jgi:hypothetical protein
MSEKWRENQVDGDHYRKHKIQPWDIRKEYGLNPWEADVIKYVLRRKPEVNRIIDLKKARHCLDYLIEEEESKAATELLARQSLAAAREAIQTHTENDKLERQERLIRAGFYWGHHAEGQV